MVARIVTCFVLPVCLNFLGMRFEHGTDAHVHGEVHRLTVLNTSFVEDLQPVALVELDHLGVPHRHDVGAATLNHEFQGVAHQSERQVLAPVGPCHREPPDLKSGVLGVSAGGKRRSFEHVAGEIGRQAERLAFRWVEADVADQIVALNARDEVATGVFKDAISVRVVLMQLVGVDVVANC